MRTYSPKAHELSNEWLIIDATDVVLGRLATHAATLLRGKHKATFAPHMDNGDFVIIINADKVALTGSKLLQKKAYRHSGYPGGLTATTYAELLEKSPEKAVSSARLCQKTSRSRFQSERRSSWFQSSTVWLRLFDQSWSR